MSEGLGLLIAIAIMILLFALLLVFFEEKHPLLRYLFIMGILVSGFFVPSAVYQLRTTCDTIVANATVVNSSLNSYSYAQQCFTTTSTTPDTFYTVMWSIYQIVIIYFILKMLYLLLHPLWERLKRW